MNLVRLSKGLLFMSLLFFILLSSSCGNDCSDTGNEYEVIELLINFPTRTSNGCTLEHNPGLLCNIGYNNGVSSGVSPNCIFVDQTHEATNNWYIRIDVSGGCWQDKTFNIISKGAQPLSAGLFGGCDGEYTNDNFGEIIMAPAGGGALKACIFFPRSTHHGVMDLAVDLYMTSACSRDGDYNADPCGYSTSKDDVYNVAFLANRNFSHPDGYGNCGTNSSVLTITAEEWFHFPEYTTINCL